MSCSPQNAEPFKAADSTLVAGCPARPCMHSLFSAWRDTATLKHFAERGMNDCGDGSDPRKCVTKMVTPRVEAAAQLYFGCDTLQGAELENQVRCSCSSSRVWQHCPLAGVGSHTFRPGPILSHSRPRLVLPMAAIGSNACSWTLSCPAPWATTQSSTPSRLPCLKTLDGTFLADGSADHDGGDSDSFPHLVALSSGTRATTAPLASSAQAPSGAFSRAVTLR